MGEGLGDRDKEGVKTRKVNKQAECTIRSELKDGCCIDSRPHWTGRYRWRRG